MPDLITHGLTGHLTGRFLRLRRGVVMLIERWIPDDPATAEQDRPRREIWLRRDLRIIAGHAGEAAALVLTLARAMRIERDA